MHEKDAWITEHGGLQVDGEQNHAKAVFFRLTSGHPDLNVQIYVLASHSVCAYAWPDCSIFVTSGLLERASDDVLSAALAHELGHLIIDGRVKEIASLKGTSRSGGAERRADAYAQELLRAKMIPTTALPLMLTIVRDSNRLTQACRQDMSDRIAALR